jgi:hypothetical protein
MIKTRRAADVLHASLLLVDEILESTPNFVLHDVHMASEHASETVQVSISFIKTKSNMTEPPKTLLRQTTRTQFLLLF